MQLSWKIIGLCLLPTLAACETSDPAVACTSAEAHSAVRELMSRDLATAAQIFGWDLRDPHLDELSLENVQLVSHDEGTGRIECVASVGPDGPMVSYSRTDNLSEPGTYLYQLGQTSDQAAMAVLNAAGPRNAARPARTDAPIELNEELPVVTVPEPSPPERPLTEMVPEPEPEPETEDRVEYRGPGSAPSDLPPSTPPDHPEPVE